MPNMRPKRAKILIVDDHPMIREGLIMRISSQPELEVCGEAESSEQALQLVEERVPDLVLVDISLKDSNGIELVKEIKARHSTAKILVVSGFEESLYGERALRAGALGYLSKRESHDNILDAIRTVLKGDKYISPETLVKLANQSLHGRDTSGSPSDILSDRELEVFRLIGMGQTSSAIANQLFLSNHTIDSHRENIKRKLELKNAGELTRAAVQWVLEHG